MVIPLCGDGKQAYRTATPALHALVLHLKEPYFNQIKAGSKNVEYRILSDYWEKRFYDEYGNCKNFSEIIVLLGYPKTGTYDKNNFMSFQWSGFTLELSGHPELTKGKYESVAVFAIPLIPFPDGHLLKVV